MLLFIKYWKMLCIIFAIYIIFRLIKKYLELDEEDSYNHLKDIKPNYYESTLGSENIYEKQGYEAEVKIVRILERIFLSDRIIHDSYFRDEEIVTTQVDIIVVDETGIYVIESKDFSGIIKGNTKSKSWVQLFRNKKYTRFSSPVIQNNRHIKDIKTNLKDYNIPNEAFKSYIVFGNNCKLDIQNNENVVIIKQNELFYKILQDKNESCNVISTEDVEKISRRLMAHSNVSEEMKLGHIRRIKKIT